ncbi:glycosyltransferase [Pseudonocardia alni]|uniref:glycosyltransferase n=1 Tax=Pseudonocardia alni TaxID=33907 RepID=UPI00331F93B4
MSSFVGAGVDVVWSALVPFRQDWPVVVTIGVIGVLSWSTWAARRLLSCRYRPHPPGWTTTVSVVVPSFREDPAVLLDCLRTWLAEDPDEVLVVLDGDDPSARAALLRAADPRLHVVVAPRAGKRAALATGIRLASGEVVVLTDSDTRWEPGLLVAVQAPFADPAVGAVGTRQNVFRPDTALWRRVADWIIDNRYLDHVPATGRAGAVVCVSGRTAAYRRRVVLPVLAFLEDERFLGRRCVAGDDGRLTWLVLASGHRTVHQSTARATSMFPSTFRGFCRQRVRWARNSYRCYLTAVWNGWLWRVPVISQLTVVQILLTPVTGAAAVYYVVLAGTQPRTALALPVALVWLMVGRGVRSVAHLRRRPSDVLLLPLVTLVVLLVALPIKTWAFVTMNRQAWLTRDESRTGGEAQDAASVRLALPVPRRAVVPVRVEPVAGD